METIPKTKKIKKKSKKSNIHYALAKRKTEQAAALLTFLNNIQCNSLLREINSHLKYATKEERTKFFDRYYNILFDILVRRCGYTTFEALFWLSRLVGGQRI